MQPTDLIPESWRADAQRMAAALRDADRVLVAAHENPDGDALGSLAAAAHMLRALGREFCLYVAPRTPAALAFLRLPATPLDSPERLPFAPRCALLLDCGERHRLGQALADWLPVGLPVCNIDHHIGDGMGDAVWVQPQAAATAQLMAYVALALGLPLAGDLADAIGVGLLTDTGGFAHGNTSADVLRLAAHLTEMGCDLHALRQEIDNCWTPARLRLWGLLMERAELLRTGSIALCAARLDDLRRTGALREDLEGLVEQLRRVRGVKVAAVLREDAPDCCKFSLRSSGPVDVRSMAAVFGGGGHRNAAGGRIAAPLAEARAALLAALEQGLAEDAAPR